MRLRIRPYEPEDACELAAAVAESQPELYRWMDWAHPGYSLDDAARWLAERPRLFRQGSEYEHAVFVTLDDGVERYAGGCAVNLIRPAEGIANLGYWVRSSLAGRGIATGAARLLVELARNSTDLRQLEIVCASGNHASRRVAAKLGAVDTGPVAARLMIHGRPHEAFVYRLDLR
ncbi:MAG: GNAT family N-acetyltransferase [Holophagales bacterium]|nr:MAG: GNAT family N-acetyltransferase [Holophagales bacterium]